MWCQQNRQIWRMANKQIRLDLHMLYCTLNGRRKTHLVTAIAWLESDVVPQRIQAERTVEVLVLRAMYMLNCQYPAMLCHAMPCYAIAACYTAFALTLTSSTIIPP